MLSVKEHISVSFTPHYIKLGTLCWQFLHALDLLLQSTGSFKAYIDGGAYTDVNGVKSHVNVMKGSASKPGGNEQVFSLAGLV